MSTVQSAVKAVLEGFSDAPAPHKREVYTESIAAILAFIISLTILSFIGKYLWNNVVVDLVSIAKPARSIWQILGLSIFVSLVGL
jgi:hypothetical protein